MEKLIKLLNEYVKSIKALGEWTVDEYNCIHYNDIGFVTSELRIISKWYGFIKWLVENEKINVKEIGKIGMTKMKGEPTSYMFDKIYSDLESLLMLLSIQDEPIEFLVSILK